MVLGTMIRPHPAVLVLLVANKSSHIAVPRPLAVVPSLRRAPSSSRLLSPLESRLLFPSFPTLVGNSPRQSWTPRTKFNPPPKCYVLLLGMSVTVFVRCNAPGFSSNNSKAWLMMMTMTMMIDRPGQAMVVTGVVGSKGLNWKHSSSFLNKSPSELEG